MTDALALIDRVALAMTLVDGKGRSEQKRLVLAMRAAGMLGDHETTLAIVFLGLGNA